MYIDIIKIIRFVFIFEVFFYCLSVCGFWVCFVFGKKTTTNELLLGFEFEIHGRVVDGS